MNTEEKDTLGGEDTETELEFDENGDVIIPDDEEGGEDAAEESEDTEEGEDGEEPENEEEDEETEEETEEGEDEEPPAPDAEKEELRGKVADLEKTLAALTKGGRAALAKLGVKDAENLLDALETLAAEAEGKSLDDYRKERRDAEEVENARSLARRSAYEAMKKADLDALHAAYPETADLTDVENMPNFKRFGELRDKGLSPAEAYAAANPDAIRRSGAEAGKKSTLKGTKTHLKSNVPKGASTGSISMTPDEKAYWRDMFPDKTDKEILALYKRANS